MYNIIPNRYIINQKNINKHITYNNYKKTEVIKEFEKSMFSGNIEKSILWSSELLASGFHKEIYKKLINFYITDINKSNINMIEILEKEMSYFYEICKEKDYDYKNTQYFRNHIAKLTCLMTFSTKCKLPKLNKIDPVFFNMENNKKRLLTKDLQNIKRFITEEDNKNIIIPLSEIHLNLNTKNLTKSLDNCLFWLNWISTYEKNFHKNSLCCHSSKIYSKYKIDEKYKHDFTWIVWEIIFSIYNDNKYINLLYNLYCIDFNKSTKIKKIDIIIFVFLIIIDPIPNINYKEMIINPENNIIYNKIILSINLQYQDLLQNKQINKNIQNNINSKDISPFFSKEKFYPTATI